VQGIGLGLVFIPLNITAFGTLDPRYRTEASSLMNLSRNIGGSAGISVVTALLARNIQTAHSEIGQHIPDPGLVANDPVVSSITGGATDTVLAMADAIVNKQAAMVAYLDDFKLMMILTLGSIPLVFLLQRPAAPKVGDEPVHVAMD
jgi:DHA2 family multidrug resistance protein